MSPLKEGEGQLNIAMPGKQVQIVPSVPEPEKEKPTLPLARGQTSSYSGAGGASPATPHSRQTEYVNIIEKPPPTRCQLAKKHVKKWFKRRCKTLCGSRVFATITTLLTFFALFGDDMRLLFASKKDDQYFDYVTMTAMVAFAIEIVAFSGGKPEYLFGFFFWLDNIATVTLVLDITTVGESLFGDSISSADAGSGGRGGGSDSTEAARAARMSRAGTKAGRVVRLIRLLRLIKMLKVFQKKDNSMNYPGDDFEDDDEENDSNIQESAVSKKLSEMTTRRVIVLVLVIILMLPIFSTELFMENMNNSGQFGMNQLYRRFRDSLDEHDPLASAADGAAYMSTMQRQVYQDLFLLYLYKHNWFSGGTSLSGKTTPLDNFNRLFWIGASPSDSAYSQYIMPSLPTSDWNAKWNNNDWDFVAGDLPDKAKAELTKPWSESRLCVLNLYRGISLIEKEGSESVQCPEELRFQERTALYPQMLTDGEANQVYFLFVFDRREGSRYEAMLNTFQTLFVCALLGFGSMTFQADANKLVLAPIERMISKLERIRNNPLEALKIGDEENHKEQVKAHKKQSMRISDLRFGKLCSGSMALIRRACPCCKRCLGTGEARSGPEPMETQVLERTIIKIGSLLALGFGEAGAEIIGSNMKDEATSSAIGMIPGRKVEAVFAFCDIRNFNDATEVLQDSVMQFVNRIAKEVHSLCDEFWGNPNKNVGDAFLLVWRLTGEVAGRPIDQAIRSKLTDMSLMSVTSMIGRVATSSEMAEYRTHSKLLKRIPHFRVKIGFGMHLGWAIEGAIGSEFKIDASYLSPNVNLASTIQNETAYYGASILLSDAVRDTLSEELGTACRMIEKVELEEGGSDPMKLYTFDLDDGSVDLELMMETQELLPLTKSTKFKQRWERLRRRTERMNDDYELCTMLETDEIIAIMRKRYTEEFFCRFKMAYLNYEAGNWPIASVMLKETRFILGIEDGVSTALLKLLADHDNVAPSDWHGFRPHGIQGKSELAALDEGDVNGAREQGPPTSGVPPPVLPRLSSPSLHSDGSGIGPPSPGSPPPVLPRLSSPSPKSEGMVADLDLLETQDID